uniref:Uncharacterized protein n=1 Tax=Arundo donax TaxID=35708 RepID=A0A0A8Z2G7_ARUDO
MLISMKLSKAN